MAHSIDRSFTLQHIAPTEWHKKIYTEIKMWHRDAVTRKQLKNLPEHLFDDIGINREEAMQEVNRFPFRDALFFWV
ncbi:DUF1127 domain-containing protein [Vibrio sp. RC27]